MQLQPGRASWPHVVSLTPGNPADTWVSRDLGGNPVSRRAGMRRCGSAGCSSPRCAAEAAARFLPPKFVKTDPIARDERTIDLLHRGLPIPVKW